MCRTGQSSGFGFRMVPSGQTPAIPLSRLTCAVSVDAMNPNTPRTASARPDLTTTPPANTVSI
jgi:hypothetical protein